MSSERIISIVALAIAGAVPALPAANAQAPVGSTFQDRTQADPHRQRIYQMMKDMTQEMSRMTEEMLSQGELPPHQQKQMAQRMQFMSTMMHRLSGLEARPAN